MVSDSVETVRAKTRAPTDGSDTSNHIEQVIQDWLDANSGITSLDFVEFAEEGQNYTVITFIYTA